MATRRYRRRTLGNKISDVDKRLKYLERRPARSTLRDFIVQTSKIQDRSVTIEKLSEELISDQDDVDAQLEAIEEEQKVLEDNINTVEGLAQSSANYKRATDPTTVKSISQVETNDGVVTFTTSTAHEFLPNNAVKVQGFSGAFIKFNGTYAVKTVPTSTTFTITKNTGLANDIYAGGGTVAISPSYGDTWWDTNSDNEPKTWNGSTWDSVRDETISVAQDAADAAQLSADGKSKVFRTSSAPTATAVGDIWFDIDGDVNTGEGDRPYRWNGTAWESFGLSYLAVKSLDANTITTGELRAILVKTSDTGLRVEMDNSFDGLKFYGTDNNLKGYIQTDLTDRGIILESQTVSPLGDSFLALFSNTENKFILETTGEGSINTSDGLQFFDTNGRVHLSTATPLNNYNLRDIYIPNAANVSATGSPDIGSIWLEWS